MMIIISPAYYLLANVFHDSQSAENSYPRQACRRSFETPCTHVGRHTSLRYIVVDKLCVASPKDCSLLVHADVIQETPEILVWKP